MSKRSKINQRSITNQPSKNSQLSETDPHCKADPSQRKGQRERGRRVLLLALVILLPQWGLSQSLMTSVARKKAPSKDSEFVDPLLEGGFDFDDDGDEFGDEEDDGEANSNLRAEIREKNPTESAVETRNSNFPVEENEIPQKVQPSLSEKDPFEVVSPLKSMRDQNLSEQSQSERPSNLVVDDEIEAMVSFGDDTKAVERPAFSEPSRGARIGARPRWDPKDPSKGFLRVTEDGDYVYKEESGGYEKTYKEDYRVVPNRENYQKGLIRVASDGAYIYKGESSVSSSSASFRVASQPPLPIENSLGILYEDIYGEGSRPLFLLDYDWLQWKTATGIWALTLGFGFSQAEGPGFFLDTREEAFERYSLYFLMSQLGLTYRLQYSSHPWIVPYFSVGAVPAVLFETRDDGESRRYQFLPGIQGAGGLRLNLGKLDSISASSLDAEYGISNMWIDVEFKRLQGFDESIDISSNLISMGLGFDF